MKLVSLLPIASLASLGLVSAADITVKASVDTVKSTAVLVNTGAKIQFCPTGTCDTLSYTIAPTKVAEYDGTNAVTGQAVTSFNAAETAIWGTTPTDVKTGETVVGKAYKFTTALMADTKTLGNLEITATYYSVATDVSYATKTIKVPAGGVKFAAKVTDWAFDSTDSVADNKVKVDFTITSTSKTGTGDAATATVPKLASTVGSDGISLTTTIGDGMFLDVPNKAITATTADPPVTANVDVVPTLTGTAPFVLTLEMPNFKDKTLTYDPVMYYTAPSSGTDGTPAATTAAPSTTPAPSGASSVWGYAASVFVGAAGLAALMF